MTDNFPPSSLAVNQWTWSAADFNPKITLKPPHTHSPPTQVFPLMLSDQTSSQDCVDMYKLHPIDMSLSPSCRFHSYQSIQFGDVTNSQQIIFLARILLHYTSTSVKKINNQSLNSSWFPSFCSYSHSTQLSPVITITGLQ